MPLKLCLVLSALLLGLYGVVIWRTPDQELHYYRDSPMRGCAPGGRCLISYALRVGNTGSADIENVRVQFYPEAFAQTERPVTVWNSGSSIRQVEWSSRGKLLSYELGRLESSQFVEIKFVLWRMRADGIPDWDDVLAEITPSQGAVRTGDPRLIRFGRFLFSFFRLFC